MLHCKRERVRGQYDDPPLPLPRLLQIESGAMVNKIVSLAESSRYTKAEQWDADPLLLGTPGGVVDLRTGEFHPGRRDLIVMRTVVDPIPLPPAGCLDDHCPEFAAFLDWATQGDLDLINYLQRAAGYTLSGDFSEQCLFFLLGKPNSGKGTWTRILSGILGSKYAKVADRRVFSQAKPGYERHSTEVAALKGARMATFQETKEVYTWDTEKIKAMTGGDDMTARLIAKNNTDFKPTFKFWFASNNDPVVRRGDGAMQRRLRIIPFNAQFSKGADTQLDGKLKREFGMILTWMINGALAWQQTRTMSGGTGLAEPQVVTDAVKELFEQGDALDDWIDACCCVTGASLQAEKGRLYESWKAYAEPLGELKQYPSATAMGKGLELRGYKRGKATGSRRSQYTGIQPK